MLYDLLGIRHGDLAKAEELYSEIPESIEIPELESCPNGFDFRAYLLQCAAEDLYRRHGLRVAVHANFLAGSFDYCSEEREEIRKLADQGDETAEFILNH